jgi:hypothetical protein
LVRYTPLRVLEYRLIFELSQLRPLFSAWIVKSQESLPGTLNITRSANSKARLSNIATVFLYLLHIQSPQYLSSLDDTPACLDAQVPTNTRTPRQHKRSETTTAVSICLSITTEPSTHIVTYRHDIFGTPRCVESMRESTSGRTVTTLSSMKTSCVKRGSKPAGYALMQRYAGLNILIRHHPPSQAVPSHPTVHCIIPDHAGLQHQADHPPRTDR